MIKHIVFWNIVDTYEGQTKEDIMLYIKQELEKLVGLIPGLIKLEVHPNHPEAPAENYDLALYSELESFEALHAYHIHPEHQKMVNYLGKVRTERACVDYEV